MSCPPKDELTGRIVEMRGRMSARDVAKELGMTRQNVHYHLRKVQKFVAKHTKPSQGVDNSDPQA